eukprot:8427399-Pyramimonas_sp.AAC.1
MLKRDAAAAQRAQPVAAASRAAEVSGAGEADGAPEVVARKKAPASSVRKWRSGLADGGLGADQRW